MAIERVVGQLHLRLAGQEVGLDQPGRCAEFRFVVQKEIDFVRDVLK